MRARALLATGRTELPVQLDGRIIASYRHPIGEKVVRPLVGQLARLRPYYPNRAYDNRA